MEWLPALGRWPGAVWLQQDGTAYLFVNAAHILGLGMLIGAVLPLDLRLLGCFRSVPFPVIGPLLSRMAGIGLALALGTGFWLFTVRPVEYAANPAFLAKLGILAFALANVGWQHASSGYRAALADGSVSATVRLRAALSVTLWLSTLVAGRWIGFA